MPGAEWKADVAFALEGGDAGRAGELLFSDRSEAWWVEQQAMGQLVAVSGAPEFKCRIALATQGGDVTRAFGFIERHSAENDGWWRSHDPAAPPPEGQPPAGAGGGGGGGGGGMFGMGGLGLREMGQNLVSQVNSLIGRGDAVAGDVPPSVKEVVERSRRFADSGGGAQYAKHPLETQRVEALIAEPPHAVSRTLCLTELAEHIEGVRPILDARVRELLETFLRIKAASGSPIEQRVYTGMGADGLLDRLLTKRPLAFVEGRDCFLLQDGRHGQGGFQKIGSAEDTGPPGPPGAPGSLADLQSYDEMALSALVGVSVPTHFINEGARRNHGIRGSPASYESRGIMTGLVGARFEQRGEMEWKHMLITREQNTAANGYGPRAASPRGVMPPDTSLLEMWASFYGQAHLPTYDETVAAHQAGQTWCHPISQGNFLHVSVYKERMRAVLSPFLLDAQQRAEANGKEAYCHMVGLGLGVWMVTEHQALWLMDVVEELLQDLSLPNIGTLDFSWFPHICEQHPLIAQTIGQLLDCQGGHRVKIKLSSRDPAAKLQMSDSVSGKPLLLVVMYAWDSNSYPGNEYWLTPVQGENCLSASGDPAAAACSTIAELQNPEINPRICAANAFYLGGVAPPQKDMDVDFSTIHQDPEAWQHAAIDASRDGKWDVLERLILPQGSQPLMPDHLLNGFPVPRTFNILHQLSMQRDAGEAGPTETLRRLVNAGCRFNPSVLTKETAGYVHSRQTGAEDMAGGNLTARQIAEQWDCPAYMELLAHIEVAWTAASADVLTKGSSCQVGGGGGGGGGMALPKTVSEGAAPKDLTPLDSPSAAYGGGGAPFEPEPEPAPPSPYSRREPAGSAAEDSKTSEPEPEPEDAPEIGEAKGGSHEPEPEPAA